MEGGQPDKRVVIRKCLIEIISNRVDILRASTHNRYGWRNLNEAHFKLIYISLNCRLLCNAGLLRLCDSIGVRGFVENG